MYDAAKSADSSGVHFFPFPMVKIVANNNNNNNNINNTASGARQQAVDKDKLQRQNVATFSVLQKL